MSSYNQEQYDALDMVRRYVAGLGKDEKAGLVASLDDYLQFRQSVDDFLQTHFGSVCNQACYQSRLSACCSREGIVTFFAEQIPSGELQRQLARRRINTSTVPFSANPVMLPQPRQPELLRASLHYYNTGEEIERFVAELRQLLS